MPEAHIAMCNSLNKVHSYLAHPLFAPVEVGMRALATSSTSIHHLCIACCSWSLLSTLCYLYTLSKLCIIILFMLLLICLHYLDFSRAGICMLQIEFSLATAMCMLGSSACMNKNLPQKFTCIFRTACQNNFKFSVQLGQALYFCVAQLLNWTGVQKKFPRRVCGGGPFWHRQTFAALELRLGKISSYKSAFTQFMRWSTCIAKTICIAKVQKEI